MRFALAALFFATTLAAQPTARTELNAANMALAKGDHAAYLEHAERVLTLDHDRLGQPFYQYHAARARALNGHHEQALVWLTKIWDEAIEGPMATHAELDPAFVETRKLASYRALMKKVDELELKVTPLGANIAQLEGAGCNLVVAWGADGAILVDSGYPRVAAAVARAVRKATGGAKVRFIVNTHEHLDHAGGNEAFPGAAIVAHPRSREVLSRAEEFVFGFNTPPLVKKALPSVLAEKPVTIHINDADVQVIPLPAHSGSDVIVWFPREKVLHMGDNFFPTATRRIYPGRNPEAFLAAFGPFVQALPDDVKVVSGHEAVVPVTRLRELYAATEKLVRERQQNQ